MINASMPWPVIAFIGYGFLIILINLGIALGERLHDLTHRRIHGLIALAAMLLAIYFFLHAAAAAGYIALSVFVIFLCAIWHGCDVENEENSHFD